MKVWVVTAGEYDDYHIDSLHSTEEKAKKYINDNNIFNLGDFNSPYEMEIDINENSKPKYLYLTFNEVDNELNHYPYVTISEEYLFNENSDVIVDKNLCFIISDDKELYPDTYVVRLLYPNNDTLSIMSHNEIEEKLVTVATKIIDKYKIKKESK